MNPFEMLDHRRNVARWALNRLGTVRNFVEPFAGTFPLFLNRQHVTTKDYETVNDRCGLFSNFWRAVRASPAEVEHFAADPADDAERESRVRWLSADDTERIDQLRNDPFWFCPTVAGWWVWWLRQWMGQPAYPLPQLMDRLRMIRSCCGNWFRVCNSTSTTSGIAGTGVLVYPPNDATTFQDVAAWFQRSRGFQRQDRLRVVIVAAPEATTLFAGLGLLCLDIPAEVPNAPRERMWYTPNCQHERAKPSGGRSAT